jgi:hypothetical protein
MPFLRGTRKRRSSVDAMTSLQVERKRNRNSISSRSKAPAAFWLNFDPEYGGDTFLRNVVYVRNERRYIPENGNILIRRELDDTCHEIRRNIHTTMFIKI